MAVIYMLLSVLAFIFLAGVALMIYGMLTAPEGQEDELGFHPREKAGVNVSDRDEDVVTSGESHAFHGN